MLQITVNDEIVRALKSSDDPVKLCDSKGQLIAILVRGDDNQPMLIDLPPLPTEEELREILAQPRYTFEQVMEGLEG